MSEGGLTFRLSGPYILSSYIHFFAYCLRLDIPLGSWMDDMAHCMHGETRLTTLFILRGLTLSFWFFFLDTIPNLARQPAEHEHI